MTLNTSDQSRKQGEPRDSSSPNSEKMSEEGSHSAEGQSYEGAIKQGLRRNHFNRKTTEIYHSSQPSGSLDYHSRSMQFYPPTNQLSEALRSSDYYISAFQRVGHQNSFPPASLSQESLNYLKQQDSNNEATLNQLTKQYKDLRKKALGVSQGVEQGNFNQPDASQDIQQKNSGFVGAGGSYASQFTDYSHAQSKPRKRRRVEKNKGEDQSLLRLPPDVQSTNQTSKNQNESQNPQGYQSEIDQGENPLRLEIASTSPALKIKIDNLVNPLSLGLASKIRINNLVN